MQINLSELFPFDGMSKDYEVSLSQDTFSFGRVLYPVLSSKKVFLHIVHRKDRQLQVSGHTELVLGMSCSRCVEPVKVPFSLELNAMLDLNRIKTMETETKQDQYYVEDDLLDVDLFVFDELSLHIPIRVLCSEDCKGLCPTCGANRNKAACTCAQEALDPRMARIAEIFKNAKEV